jgi:flagellar hook-length control protein FliK
MMSVAPDFLMTATTSLSIPSSAKFAADDAASNLQATDSFSQVYAREQQATDPGAAASSPHSGRVGERERPQDSDRANSTTPREDSESASDSGTSEAKAAIKRSGAPAHDKIPRDAAGPLGEDSVAADGEEVPGAEEVTEIAAGGKTLPVDSEEDVPADTDGVDDSFLLLGLFQPTARPIETAPQALAEWPETTAEPVADTSAGALSERITVNPLAPADFDLEGEDREPLPESLLNAESAAVNKAKPTLSAQSGDGPLSAGTEQTLAASLGAVEGTASGGAAANAEVDTAALSESGRLGLDSAEGAVSDTSATSSLKDISGLSQLIAQPGAAAGRSSVLPGQPVAMQTSGWSDGVVDKVMWMSSQNLKSAQIQLEPAELGRLDVHISMDQEQTLVSFSSANTGVREALEGQSQRLRDMFTQQGMNLVDVNVSDQSQGRDGQGQGGNAGGRAPFLADYTAEEEPVIGSIDLPTATLGSSHSLVDFYA